MNVKSAVFELGFVRGVVFGPRPWSSDWQTTRRHAADAVSPSSRGCLPKPAKSNGFLWISHFAPTAIF